MPLGLKLMGRWTPSILDIATVPVLGERHRIEALSLRITLSITKQMLEVPRPIL